MLVYSIRLKIFFLCDVPLNKIQKKITNFLDKGFAENEELLERHEENTFKGYVFDFPYPSEPGKVYRKGKIYTLTVRTIEPTMARYFSEVCVNTYTNEIKGLTVEMRILPKKFIQTLYTLTPAILKDEKGYWRKHMSLSEFEERMKVNLIKKWNHFTGEKLNEDFQFYTMLEFLNQGPIVMEYKNVKLLGDKVRLQIADNDNAQKLAYMSLGTGLLEMNSRGAGFVNYRWL